MNVTSSVKLPRSRVRVASYFTNDSRPSNLGLTWILSPIQIYTMTNTISSSDCGERPFRHSYHWNYFLIANDALEQARSFENDLNLSSTDSITKRIHYEGRLTNAVFVSVVFSALFVEAFANFILREKLSGFFRERYDSLDPLSKLICTLKQAYNHDLSPDSTLSQRIAKLSKRRNTFVHAKPMTFSCTHEDQQKYIASVRFEAKHAVEAVETCRQLLSTLNGIDSTIEAGLLRQEEWYRIKLPQLASTQP